MVTKQKKKKQELRIPVVLAHLICLIREGYLNRSPFPAVNPLFGCPLFPFFPLSLFPTFPLSLPPSVTFLPSVFIPHIYRALHRYLPFISHATPHTFASATTHTSIFSVSVAYYLIPYPYLILIIKHVYSGHFLLDFSSPSSGLRHVPKSSKNCKHQWFCRPDL